MAKYKEAAGSPSRGVRLDGQAWSPSGNGGTIKGWQYPKPWASPMFDRMNGNARNLDAFWDSLTSDEQNQWETASRDGRDWTSCAEEEAYSS